MLVGPRLGQTAAILVFAFVCMCVVVGVLPYFQSNDLRDGYTSQSVPMVDPSGSNPQTDYQYSITNKNNADANKTNAEGQVQLAVATKIVAEACDISNNCVSPIQTSATKMINTMALALVVIVIVFVVGFLLVAKRT